LAAVINKSDFGFGWIHVKKNDVFFNVNVSIKLTTFLKIRPSKTLRKLGKNMVKVKKSLSEPCF